MNNKISLSRIFICLLAFICTVAFFACNNALKEQSTGKAQNAQKLYLIGGGVLSDLPQFYNDVYSSSDGAAWTKEETTNTFSARVRHQVVVFKDKLYLVSGEGERKSDIWSSSDGKTWEEVTDAAAFSARSGHQVVAFKNKLYLIGGGNKNDVWSSSDGKTWEEVTDAAEFSVRHGHQVVVFPAAQ